MFFLCKWLWLTVDSFQKDSKKALGTMVDSAENCMSGKQRKKEFPVQTFPSSQQALRDTSERDV